MRFDVAMENASLVGICESGSDLDTNFDDLIFREPACGNRFVQGWSFDELVDNKGRPFFFVVIVNSDDGGMVENRGRSCLPSKAAAVFSGPGARIRKHLYGYGLAELFVARPIDYTHASSTDFALDRVTSEPGQHLETDVTHNSCEAIHASAEP